MKLQFTNQQYQIDCISNILEIFQSLEDGKNFQDILQEHANKHKYQNIFSNKKNIDIMMETGTGKTFTFIKTIFELNKNFSYNKFIILVPSIAILEGTKKNLEITKTYFKEHYNKEIDYLSNIDFYIKNLDKLSVLIMTPHSFNKGDKNIINKAYENELPFENDKTILDALKRINPIVIIDEPHKFDGKKFKQYFEGFNNYFLRFGATFPVAKKDDTTIEFSNICYILNGIDAFSQCLVKRIQVLAQGISSQKQDILKKIDFKNQKIETMSYKNGKEQIVSKSVGEIFNNFPIKEIKRDNILLNNDEVYKIEDFEYILTEEGIRQMIKSTIQLHFEKEKQLFEKGIKVLSLFFIRNIHDFKGENPMIKRIFEEEYRKQWNEVVTSTTSLRYKEYLLKDSIDGNLQVHKGYFSGDGKNEKEDVDLILKEKEKLLSFQTQARFIFSVWALQEGWDNPNIFQICKLSNYGSENSKLQQIGRGLRICVNQNGERQTLEKYKENKEDFWEINTLSVIIPASEVDFVKGIQEELSNNFYITKDEFTLKEINDALAKHGISTLEGRKFLEKNDIIEGFEKDGEEYYKKTENYKENLEKLQPTEKISQEQISKLKEMLNSSTIKNYINDGKFQSKLIQVKKSYVKEFEALWNEINKKAEYIIKDLTNQTELINKIAKEINKLKITPLSVQSKLHTHNIQNNTFDEEVVKVDKVSNSKFNFKDFIFEISSTAKIPIDFTLEIFNNIEDKEMIKNNPRQAKAEIIEIIKQNLVESIKTTIEYNVIEGEITSNAQTSYKASEIGKTTESYPNPFHLQEKWIFEEIIAFDSVIEKEIICEAKNKEIEIFAKMPKLKITTPLGTYSPDFCYTIKTEEGKKIILIVEAKGYDTETDIPKDESNKIAFAEKFFEKLNKGTQNVNIHYKKRINKQELSQIISEIIK
jgi:type III restriction enzyme